MNFSLQNYNEEERYRIIGCEDLDPQELEWLFNAVCNYLQEWGFNVVKENDDLDRYKYIYQNIVTFNENHVKENEGVLLCASNGKDIVYSNHQCIDNCCQSMVIYNVLHMMGHLWQWNCNDKSSGLKYTGDQAWDIGKKIYQEEAGNSKQDIIDYEAEAIVLSLQLLQDIYSKCALSEMFKEKFEHYYKYYSLIDLNSLLLYFETTEYANIYRMTDFPIKEISVQYPLSHKIVLNIRKRKR